MKRKKVKAVPSSRKLTKIKVWCDEKTTVTINRMESFATWKLKYPNAKIIK